MPYVGKKQCNHGKVYSPTHINDCASRTGFSNFFAGVQLNEL